MRVMVRVLTAAFILAGAAGVAAALPAAPVLAATPGVTCSTANGVTTCIATNAAGSPAGTCAGAGTAPCTPPGALCTVTNGTSCVAGTVASGGGFLPASWDTPDSLQNNAAVQAFFKLVQWPLAVFGMLVIAYGLWSWLMAIHDAFRGKAVASGAIIQGVKAPPVLTRLAEIVGGIILVVIVLSGAWVPLINAIASAMLNVVGAVIKAVGAL